MDARFACEMLTRGADGEEIVAVRGDVDLATAPELESFVRRVIDGAPASVVLDFEGLAFLDSSGLRVLAALSSEAGSRGVSFRLRNVSRSTRRILDLTGMSDMLGLSAES